MKKILLLASLMTAVLVVPVVASTSNKQESNEIAEAKTLNVKQSDKVAKIEFDTLRMNLGTFPASSPIRKCTFKFTNTGTAPLVIHQALASCGCTVPNFSKTPIKPNESGTIEVTYNGTGKFAGFFTKTVTVRSNAENEVVRLTVEGTMTE